MDDKWNRCDVCGRFIAMDDFDSGDAQRYMLTPDSYRSTEEWATSCKAHAEHAHSSPCEPPPRHAAAKGGHR